MGQDDAWIPETNGIPIHNIDYIADFDSTRQLPFWVAYELLPEETMGEAVRKSSFKRDERVKNGAVHGDYTHSGYDRGHLKPAADSKSSQERMDASFLMTNVAPQSPALNRGSWKQLEERVRSWTQEYGAIHVVCGPGPETIGTLGEHDVAIPADCWKAVLRTAPDTACIAFLMPNTMEKLRPFAAYRITVDSLEHRLGIDLFPQLPHATEQHIERQIDSPWSGMGP